ncbi:MATE family efflux transporter [Rhodovibrionaceae bacterium A322]
MKFTNLSPSLQAKGAGPWLGELRTTLMLAFPLILTQLGQIGVGTTDVLMIGWLGPQSLAASTLSFTVYFTMWIACIGVLQAVAPLVSQAIGAGDFRGVRRTVRQGLWASILLSVPCMIVLWYSKDVLLLLGQEETTSSLAQEYLRASLWGFLPSFGFIVLRSFLAAMSKPNVALVATFCLLIFNAAGNYALIFGNFGFPRLELVGAGITSALGQWGSFLGTLIYILLHGRLRRFHILVRFWRPDWERFRLLFKVGLPIGGTMLAESSLFSLAAIMMGWLGTTQLAAHAIAIQITATAFMIPLGLGQAATVRVGLAVGRKDRLGIALAGWTAMGLCLVLMFTTASLFWIFPETLVGFFLDFDNPVDQAAAQLAVSLIFVAGVFQLADGGQAVVTHLLRGLNDTRTPMFFCWFGYWGIGLTSALLFGFVLEFDAVGIWYGLAAGLFVVSIWGVIRFARREKLGLVPSYEMSRP